jgi:dolichol-phosphate hexosyltransferase
VADDAPTLSVLMPVYNERATVRDAIEQVLSVDFPVSETQVVVVNDGSTDGTGEALADGGWPERVTVVSHERNRGKGAAVRTALTHARGTYAAIMDADLEYDPRDIVPLLERLQSGDSDAVFGTRGFQSHSAYSFWYVIGNKAVTLAANLLYNSWVTDIMTCHKVMRTDLMRSLNLSENGFAIEPEITARLLRAGVRIYEVPITYRARTRQQGKKLTSVDGFRVLVTLVRCRVT